MLDIFMNLINVLTIGILLIDWRLEGKGDEPIFTAGMLRFILVLVMSLELLDGVLNLLWLSHI